MTAVLGVVAVLTAAAAGASPISSAAAPAAGAKVKSGPGRWVQLSGGTGLENIDDPAVHRFGTSLQVVWTEDTPTGQALHTRVVAADGAPASANQTLLSWTSVNENPALIAHDGQRLIVFSGHQNTSGSNPYAQGYGYYLTSPNGTAWTLAHATLGSSTALSGSSGTDATDAAGTPEIAYTDGSHNGYRAGFDSLPPATADQSTPTQQGTCCTYDLRRGRPGARRRGPLRHDEADELPRAGRLHHRQGHQKGTHTITFSDNGYAGGTVRVRVA